MVNYYYRDPILSCDIEVWFRVEESFLRRLFLGFASLHILHQAAAAPVFGLQLMEQLAERSHEISAGTLYPLLHQLEAAGLLTMETRTVEGKVRKYYRTTVKGAELLARAESQAVSLLAWLQESPPQ